MLEQPERDPHNQKPLPIQAKAFTNTAEMGFKNGTHTKKINRKTFLS